MGAKCLAAMVVDARRIPDAPRYATPTTSHTT